MNLNLDVIISVFHGKNRESYWTAQWFARLFNVNLRQMTQIARVLARMEQPTMAAFQRLLEADLEPFPFQTEQPCRFLEKQLLKEFLLSSLERAEARSDFHACA